MTSTYLLLAALCVVVVLWVHAMSRDDERRRDRYDLNPALRK